MSHYYDFDNNLKSNKRVVSMYLNDIKLSFTTDIGVFSNSEIDYGSFTFLKALLKEEKVEEGPKEVTVFLKSVGASKIPVIKAVQAITGLGLMEAKKLCDALPAPIKEKISPAAAEDIKKQLTDAGAEVEVK